MKLNLLILADCKSLFVKNIPMNKLLWTVLIMIWSAAFIILIFALTHIEPDYPFSNYKFIIVVGFITITGFMRLLYSRSKHKK